MEINLDTSTIREVVKKNLPAWTFLEDKKYVYYPPSFWESVIDKIIVDMEKIQLDKNAIQ